MKRRDFLKFSVFALGGLLARYHGAVVPGCEQLVQIGKTGGILRPQWQGVDLDAKRIIHVDWNHSITAWNTNQRPLRIKIGDLFGGYQEWIVSTDRSCRKCVDMTMGGFVVPKRHQKALIEFAKTGRVIQGSPMMIPSGDSARLDKESEILSPFVLL